jgi:hypothetical protein
MRNEKRVRMKDGRSGISGICTFCGGRMFKMVGSRAKSIGKAKIPKKGKVKINAKRKRR